jgi:hypothetical protein
MREHMLRLHLLDADRFEHAGIDARRPGYWLERQRKR